MRFYGRNLVSLIKGQDHGIIHLFGHLQLPSKVNLVNLVSLFSSLLGKLNFNKHECYYKNRLA